MEPATSEEQEKLLRSSRKSNSAVSQPTSILKRHVEKAGSGGLRPFSRRMPPKKNKRKTVSPPRKIEYQADEESEYSSYSSIEAESEEDDIWKDWDYTRSKSPLLNEDEEEYFNEFPSTDEEFIL